MIGYLDSFNPTVAGWLFCESNPPLVPIIEIYLDDRCIFKINADIPRDDVSLEIGPYDRGFSVDVNSHTTPNAPHKLRVVSFFPEYHDFGTYHITGFSKSEWGREGWLFLTNDSNHTDLKIQSDSSLFINDISKNVDQFQRRYDFFTRNGINNFSVIIPERSIICNDYRVSPLNISNSRPAITLIENIYSANILNFSYPIDIFASYKDYFYKTDTHLSLRGYKVIFEHISQFLDCFDNFLSEFPVVDNFTFKGDLSIHAASNCFEHVIEIDPSCYIDIIFDDPLVNHSFSKIKLTGSIVRSFNPKARFGKIYISGTSSAYYSVRILSLMFKEVFFEWNNSIDYKKIAEFQPDIFLWFGVERVLPFYEPDRNFDS